MEAMVGSDARARLVTIRTGMPDDAQVEISVIDKGCGIRESDADRLFTPFSTTKPSGMGMGLSISQAIVRAHGGSIGFRSNDSGGTTFWFTLPAARRDTDHE